MNFYLAAVDDMLKHPSDNPTIGLILCKGKKELVEEIEAELGSSSPNDE